jgi:hypothetical protein
MIRFETNVMAGRRVSFARMRARGRAGRMMWHSTILIRDEVRAAAPDDKMKVRIPMMKTMRRKKTLLVMIRGYQTENHHHSRCCCSTGGAIHLSIIAIQR